VSSRDNLDDQAGPTERRERDAAELDSLAAVPDEVLSDLVARHGLCLWEITSGDPPAWSGEGAPDQELAARLCAGCPVRRECLEFQLRTAGADTVGVWGGLNEDDRRALHAIWSVRAARRLRPQPPDQQTSNDDANGDEQ
jgi:WhiB family transcriptional regulator, redox-sensing transcriptional regulator